MKLLYLLEPPRRLKWLDLGSSAEALLIDRLSEITPAGLAQLGWAPADAPADRVLFEAAVRYGRACATGIILEFEYVSTVRRPGQLVEVYRNAVAAQDAIPTAQRDLVERLLPGSMDVGHEIDVRVDESTARVLDEALSDLKTMLDHRAADATLLDHWRDLGGTSAPV